LTRAEIIMDNDVSLDGEGNLIVDGLEVRGGDNVFSLPRWAKAELCGLVVTGAKGEAGIRSSGVLALRNSTVSGNEGGIRNGSIDTAEGSMTMTGVTVSGNICRQDDDCAGGIKNFGTLEMTNCTVSGNQTLSAGGQAGGIFNGGTLTIESSTVTGNTYARGEEKADIFGSYGGTITVSNSLIDADCYMEDRAVVLSNGYNIESPGSTCGFDPDGTDLVNVPDPMLGPLQDNGGPTETHALLPGSPAINQIPGAACEVTTDQRGQPRPVGDGCDVGSFERQSDDSM
jgi:hypothetical protein